MPAGKQNGITLTFSKNNADAKKKLEEAVARGWKQTKYICEAIRQFDESKVEKTKETSLDIKSVEKLVEEILAKKINELGGTILNIENAASLANDVKEDIASLEENIDNINIDED